MPQEHELKHSVLAPEELSMCCYTSSRFEIQCSSCQKVMAAEQRVRNLLDALERAMREKSEAMNQRNAHHSRFNRLPAEIACRIFALCFPPIPTLDQFYETQFSVTSQKDHIQYPQLVLGAVCQGWRCIIWSNPFFWRFISLRVTTATLASRSEVTREWLDRSGGLPLVIRLSATRNFSALNIYQGLDSVIEVLNNVAERWECVAFNIPGPYLTKFRSAKSSPIRALTLHPTDNMTVEETDGLLGFGTAPSPSNLKLWGCPIRNLRIDWQHVTRFCGSSIIVADFLKVLGRSPRMEECDLYMAIEDDQPSVQPMLVHDSLRNLDIHGRGAIEYLVSSLSCPSLHKLGMYFHHDGYELESEVVLNHQFIIRSTYSLVSLSLIDVGNEGGEEVVGFLALIPSLEDLSLSNSIGPQLFGRLGATALVQDRGRHSQFLPNLRSFTYLGYRWFPWSSIADMAPSPAHLSRRPLSHIKITINYGLSNSTDRRMADELVRLHPIGRCELKRMAELQDRGIHLSLVAENGPDVLEFWSNIYEVKDTASAAVGE